MDSGQAGTFGRGYDHMGMEKRKRTAEEVEHMRGVLRELLAPGRELRERDVAAQLRVQAPRFQTPEEARDVRLAAAYGLPQGEYQRLLSAQGGVCGICFGREVDAKQGCLKALVVDHCHDSKEIRGLLCQPCNLMLGFSKDRPEVLEAGAEYLRTRRLAPLELQKHTPRPAKIDGERLLMELLGELDAR